MSGREHGDRASFLAPLRLGLVGHRATAAPSPVPEALPRSLPAPVDTPSAGPSPGGDDSLLRHFVEAAEAVGAEVVTTAEATVPADLLADWCRAHDVNRAVCGPTPEAESVRSALIEIGVEVGAPSPSAAAAADLGVTSASALIAATGTLAIRSDVDGRLASLLPPVHLCVVPATRLVPTAGSLLRTLGSDGLPAGLVLVTGTSRTGDIEQLLTRRVHGPGTVLVVITLAPPGNGTNDRWRR